MAAEAQGVSSSGGGNATIKFGIHTQPGKYAGRTVGEVRKEAGQLWDSWDNNSQAYLGKNTVSDDHVIQPGETIDFHRKLGEKG